MAEAGRTSRRSGVADVAGRPRSSARGIAPVDGLSHVRGTTDRPLIDATIPEFLAEAVRRHRTRTAAVFRATGDRWTWDQLARRVDRFAAGLLSLGLYRGDRVGIWAPNRPEWLIAQFATARIGLILVNVNPAYRVSELEYALNKLGVKALLLARQFKSSAYVEMLRELAPELDHCPPGRLRAARLTALRTVIQLGPDPAPGCFGFDEVMDRGGGGQRWRLGAISDRLSPHDPINIQLGVGPRLIIANECLHGEGAPHCQDTTPVLDTISRAETTRAGIGGFGRASAASEWLARHAAPIACRRA